MSKHSFTSLISELPITSSAEERAKARAQLRQRYEDCQARLQDLIKHRRTHLRQTVQHCSNMMHALSETRERLRNVKNKITSCMELLRFNNSEFKKMWLESLESKYAHRILGEIEELRKSPIEIKESLMDEKLDHATDVIMTSLQLLDGNLCNAEALKDLRTELHQLQNKLYEMILDDLRQHLYVFDSAYRNFKNIVTDMTYEEIFKSVVSKHASPFRESLQKIQFDSSYVTVLLKCLSKMKRLPEVIDHIKDNCQKELEGISNSLSQFELDIIQNSVDIPVFDLPVQQQETFLLDLLDNIFCMYRKISGNFKEFLAILLQLFDAEGISVFTFTIEEIYSKIQASLERFIGLYLDLRPVITHSRTNSISFTNAKPVNDVAAYFLPNSMFENQDSYLFRFGDSYHALHMKKFSKNLNYCSEPGSSDKSVKPALVCKPSLKNITLLFSAIKSFVAEIQDSMQLSGENHCPLLSFLYDCANLFLNEVNSDINKMLGNAGINLDAWNISVISDNSNYRVNAEKHVLSCNSILNNILREIQSLMLNLPDYTNHFIHLMYYVILDYKDMFQKSFKNMFDQEQNILSISWAKDRDIRRLLKTFLNWRNLEEGKNIDIMESPEDVLLRNKEESELLIRNLRSEEMQWDVISDFKYISNLALLQENLLWFSVEVLKFVKSIAHFTPATSGNQLLPCSSDEHDMSSSVTGLRKVIKEYEDFADMCLVALHLEVRARCFRYLLPFAIYEVCAEGGFVEDLDAAVKSLTADFLKMDEVLLPILTPKEHKYVFEGLGELLASLVILIVSNLSRLNEMAVSRVDRAIYVIQCTLANITMSREVSLERARRFIDLLKATHEEILDEIVEEGPTFSETEYECIFRLISSKAETLVHEPSYYLDRLKQIFARLPVVGEDTINA